MNHGVFLTDGFTATGALTFRRARIGSRLDAAGAIIGTGSGSALIADGVQLDGDLLIWNQFTATSSDDTATVSLRAAHIGGQLSAAGATISNESGPAVDAGQARIDGFLILSDGFAATGTGDSGVVVLTDSQVGLLALDPSGISGNSGEPGWIDVDGLVYQGLPIWPTVQEWLDVVGSRTPAYAAQPYQQLAAVCRSAGHDQDVRKILIAQRRDQRKRAPGSRRERVWSMIIGFVLGYGYKPHRALWGLLAVVAVSVTLTVVAGNDTKTLAHTSRSSSPGTACSVVERIGLGLDLGLPLIKTGARETCTATSSGTGDAITVSLWLLQVAAWALATLFIAGFTGAVRKT